MLVQALPQGCRGDALGRAPLVDVEQRVQQDVDVRFASLLLHPDLQQLVDFVVGVALGDADLVVANADHPEEFVVDPHVQVLVEQIEAIP